MSKSAATATTTSSGSTAQPQLKQPNQQQQDFSRGNSFPQTNPQRSYRRDTSFLERLLSDPILQTMADIGKQEGAFITPLPITHNLHDHRRAFTTAPRRMESA